jgi:23S rRNA (cytidine1920-2'-O)/16S rRNA (cytidine1409-2'-O)-methyltransferase
VTVRRRLDAELVRRGLVPSRAQAVDAVRAGRVLVAGSRADTPSRLVDPAESVSLSGGTARYVSRGGEKLAAALAAFGVDPTGRRALDAGASTGGFTDCLLQHGAAAVVAVDVGHGQLAWSLRTDPRVTVLERTNVRSLQPADIGGAVDLAVADLSFISLATVAPALARCTVPGGDLVVLVKPQFEAGRARVGKGGIVRDPDVHRAVLRETRDAFAGHGLVVVDAVRSPLRGADGNVEFLFHARHVADAVPARGAVDDLVLDALVAAPGAAIRTGSPG